MPNGATPMEAESGIHAVLGGSAGIGLAYAMWHARRRASLFVVARDERRLDGARSALLQAGASEVGIQPADLVSESDRRQVLQQLESKALVGLFLGGPSPPPGGIEYLAAARLRQACETCLHYPYEFMTWALGIPTPLCSFIVLSSKASLEPLRGHQFYASALLRRALDSLIESLRADFERRGTALAVWRPGVVLTPLSEAFARDLTPVPGADSPVRRLAAHFNVSAVPTAADYVEQMLVPHDENAR